VACGATAPTTCAGSAELTSPKITPSAPMATTPLAVVRHLKCPIDSRYTGSADSAMQVHPV
jgi:hypothetical protein